MASISNTSNFGFPKDSIKNARVFSCAAFLKFSASRGNNLITPIPLYKFPGLKPGDKWCLCVSRWIEAEKAGKAPQVILEATHEKTLEYTSLETLIKYALINK